MTVPAQSTLFNESVANGLTTSFPYEFKIASSDDITVQLNGVTQTAGFTITGVGEDVGGSVVFSVAPDNGVTVLRYLDPVFNREENYPQFGDFNASVVNLDFDRLWLAMQSIMARISRAIKMPVATADDQVITENAADRAGKVIGFDGDGNTILLERVDVGSTIVSTIGADLLTADTAAEARTVIGAAASADLGTAASKNVGTGADNVVQLTAAAKLPAVDGSLLTNMNIPPQASTTEITNKTAVTKYISPDRLSSSKQVAKAWVNFDGTLSGPITPRGSYNVSSVTKNATGDYTINFTSAMPNANYAVSHSAILTGASDNNFQSALHKSSGALSTSSVRVVCRPSNVFNSLFDCDYITATVHGD